MENADGFDEDWKRNSQQIGFVNMKCKWKNEKQRDRPL